MAPVRDKPEMETPIGHPLQSELARLSGVHQPSISQFFSAKVDLSDKPLDRLLSCMGYRLEVVSSLRSGAAKNPTQSLGLRSLPLRQGRSRQVRRQPVRTRHSRHYRHRTLPWRTHHVSRHPTKTAESLTLKCATTSEASRSAINGVTRPARFRQRSKVPKSLVRIDERGIMA